MKCCCGLNSSMYDIFGQGSENDHGDLVFPKVSPAELLRIAR